ARLGVTTSEMSFGTEMFSQADDVFATNSLIEIESVDEVDGVNFREHQVTRRLRDAYRELVAEELDLR
ncbi:MAG TPA: hypothetical protein VMV72_12935, partial [Verrucomicrobiae bacterium]|nr:hypothetical protein [Verrucomicrobiae bacterium]